MFDKKYQAPPTNPRGCSCTLSGPTLDNFFLRSDSVLAIQTRFLGYSDSFFDQKKEKSLSSVGPEMDSGDTSEPLSFGVRLVAYHIYDLERRSEVIPWWEVTPDVVTKYKAFAQGGFGGLSLKDGSTCTDSHCFSFTKKKKKKKMDQSKHQVTFFSLIVNGEMVFAKVHF